MNLDALNKPLDAARVKQRQGRGSGSLSYLETHDVIRAANAIFGFGQWGHTIEELRPLPPTAVKNKDGKDGLHVGYVCIVRLTVADCIPVSGIGYGDAVEYTQAAPITAHELAAKEAESDALKRALKNYGDQFGLALYDKAAATSGHVVREPVKPAAQPGRDAPQAAAGTTGADGNRSPSEPAAATPSQFKQPPPPKPSETQLKAFAKALADWKALVPEFDIDEYLEKAKGKDAAWVLRNTDTLNMERERRMDPPEPTWDDLHPTEEPA